MLPLVISLGHAQATPAADQLNSTVQAVFARCRASLTMSQTLNNAALDGLQGTRTPEMLSRQGYRAIKADTLRFTYGGDLGSASQTLLSHCAEFQNKSEYGVATNGQRAALVTALPARVDLSKTSTWMSQFLQLTNRARFQGQKCGGKLMNAAPPLKWDTRLEAAAVKHVRDMITLNFRGHVNPVNGTRAQQRAEAYGFRGLVGENIQYGTVTPEAAIRELLASPEHCVNLMNPRYTKFGASVGNGSSKTLFATYWVQVFGVETGSSSRK